MEIKNIKIKKPQAPSPSIWAFKKGICERDDWFNIGEKATHLFHPL